MQGKAQGSQVLSVWRKNPDKQVKHWLTEELEHFLHPKSQRAGRVKLPILMASCWVEALKRRQLVELQIWQLEGQERQVELER